MDFLHDERFRGIERFDSKIWLASPTMHGEELKYMTEAYETNWMSTVGENINEVERIAAEKSGMKYAVGLSSCTAALHLRVKLAGERLYGKPAISHGALEGLKDLPVQMNPDDEQNSEPNFWLSCMIIDKNAMCKQVRGEQEALYVGEHGKSCPTEGLEAIASINAEGCPIRNPVRHQPAFCGLRPRMAA